LKIPRHTLAFALTLFMTAAVAAQPQQSVDPRQRLEWWTQGRFGMYIHWGIYTGLHKSPGLQARLDSCGVMERWTQA
jgi:alpha-L-fucosidase